MKKSLKCALLFSLLVLALFAVTLLGASAATHASDADAVTAGNVVKVEYTKDGSATTEYYASISAAITGIGTPTDDTVITLLGDVAADAATTISTGKVTVNGGGFTATGLSLTVSGGNVTVNGLNVNTSATAFIVSGGSLTVSGTEAARVNITSTGANTYAVHIKGDAVVKINHANLQGSAAVWVAAKVLTPVEISNALLKGYVQNASNDYGYAYYIGSNAGLVATNVQFERAHAEGVTGSRGGTKVLIRLDAAAVISGSDNFSWTLGGCTFVTDDAVPYFHVGSNLTIYAGEGGFALTQRDGQAYLFSVPADRSLKLIGTESAHITLTITVDNYHHAVKLNSTAYLEMEYVDITATNAAIHTNGNSTIKATNCTFTIAGGTKGHNGVVYYEGNGNFSGNGSTANFTNCTFTARQYAFEAASANVIASLNFTNSTITSGGDKHIRFNGTGSKLAINGGTFSGPGINLDAANTTLVLNGVTIDATSNYGMQIAANGTVTLDGNNSISGATHAIYVGGGTTTFTLTGTTTLGGSTAGFYIASGTSTITGDGTLAYAVSGKATVHIAGGTLNIGNAEGALTKIKHTLTGTAYSPAVKPNGGTLVINYADISGQYSMDIGAAASITVSNSVLTGTRTNAAAGSPWGGLAVQGTPTGEVVFTNCTIKANDAAAVHLNSGTAKLKFVNCDISSSKFQAIYVANTTAHQITVEGGTLTTPFTSSSASVKRAIYALKNSTAVFTITDATITSGQGGIQAGELSTFNLTDTKINAAKGGVFIYAGAVVTINGCTVYGGSEPAVQLAAAAANVTIGSSDKNEGLIYNNSTGAYTIHLPASYTGSINISGGKFLSLGSTGVLRLRGTGVAETAHTVNVTGGTFFAATNRVFLFNSGYDTLNFSGKVVDSISYTAVDGTSATATAADGVYAFHPVANAVVNLVDAEVSGLILFANTTGTVNITDAVFTNCTSNRELIISGSLVATDCVITGTNGLNIQTSATATITDTVVNVTGYPIRFGSNTNVELYGCSFGTTKTEPVFNISTGSLLIAPSQKNEGLYYCYMNSGAGMFHTSASSTVSITIKGGTFAALGEGYMFQHRGNTNLTIEGGTFFLKTGYSILNCGGTGTTTIKGGDFVNTLTFTPIDGEAEELVSTPKNQTAGGSHAYLFLLTGGATLNIEGGNFYQPAAYEYDYTYTPEGETEAVTKQITCKTYLLWSNNANNKVNVSGGNFYASATGHNFFGFSNGSLNISGGFFSTEKGYTNILFYTHSGAVVTISGGRFEMLESANGAILMQAQNKVTISGGSFIGSGTDMMFRFAQGADATIRGGYFQHNDNYMMRVDATEKDGATLNIYAGYFYRPSANFGTSCFVRAGAASANYGVANIYGGNFVADHLGYGDIFASYGTEEEGDTATVNVLACSATGASCIYDAYGTDNDIQYSTAACEYSINTVDVYCNASLRLNPEGVGKSGIRFTFYISKGFTDTINSIKDADSTVSYGTVVVPTKHLGEVEYFSLDILDKDYALVIPTTGIGILADEVNGGTFVRSSIYNLPHNTIGESELSYNDEYAAIFYAKYTVDGEEVYRYTMFDLNKNSASAADLANKALASVTKESTGTNTQQIIINGEMYYCKYSEAEVNVLQAYVADFIPVAEVGGVQYHSLAKAIAAAGNGATVTLLKNIEMLRGVQIAGKSITIDGNGYTLSVAGKSPVLMLSASTVNLTDITLAQNAEGVDANSAISVDSKSTLNIKADTAILTNATYAIYASGSSVYVFAKPTTNTEALSNTLVIENNEIVEELNAQLSQLGTSAEREALLLAFNRFGTLTKNSSFTLDTSNFGAHRAQLKITEYIDANGNLTTFAENSLVYNDTTYDDYIMLQSSEGGDTDTTGRYFYTVAQKSNYQELPKALMKVDLLTGEICYLSIARMDLECANDVTYVPATETENAKILVAVNGNRANELAVFEDTGSALEYKEHIELSFNMWSIDYNAEKQLYVVGISSSKHFAILDKDFNTVNVFRYLDADFTGQSVSIDNDYIYFASTSEESIMVFDWNGAFVGYIEIPDMVSKQEVEGISVQGNTVYLQLLNQDETYERIFFATLTLTK